MGRVPGSLFCWSSVSFVAQVRAVWEVIPRLFAMGPGGVFDVSPPRVVLGKSLVSPPSRCSLS